MKRRSSFEGEEFFVAPHKADLKAAGPDRFSTSSGGDRQGICLSCNNVSGCTFRRDRDRPVLFCEEFDCSTLNVSSVNSLALNERIGESEGQFFCVEGLCTNCDVKDTCMFPKPEGGVWYCEEYE